MNINCCGGYYTTRCCPNCGGTGRVAQWVPWQWQWPCAPYQAWPPRPIYPTITMRNAAADSTRARA